MITCRHIIAYGKCNDEGLLTYMEPDTRCEKPATNCVVEGYGAKWSEDTFTVFFCDDHIPSPSHYYGKPEIVTLKCHVYSIS